MYHFELKPARRVQWENIFTNNENNFTPACEIIDEEKSYIIGMDIPGLSQEDLDIEVKDNHLHISGERKQTEKTNVLRSERRYGKFSRLFSLPQNVNADLIEARFENGVLEITLPKEEKSQSKKIQILKN